MRTPATLIGIVLTSIALASPSAASKPEPIRIIVNDANAIEVLTKAQVSRFFLKKVTTWTDGSASEPVDLGEKTPARQAFSTSILGKRVAAVKAYWQQMIFSGRAVPPPEKKSEDEVQQYVLSRPGAIGYISAETEIEEGVKVVRIIDE